MYENSWNTFKASKIMISKLQNASVDGWNPAITTWDEWNLTGTWDILHINRSGEYQQIWEPSTARHFFATSIASAKVSCTCTSGSKFWRGISTGSLLVQFPKILKKNPCDVLPSWWLNQPIWKILYSQNGTLPKFRGEHKKYLSCHHLVTECGSIVICCFKESKSLGRLLAGKIPSYWLRNIRYLGLAKIPWTIGWRERVHPSPPKKWLLQLILIKKSRYGKTFWRKKQVNFARCFFRECWPPEKKCQTVKNKRCKSQMPSSCSIPVVFLRCSVWLTILK